MDLMDMSILNKISNIIYSFLVKYAHIYIYIAIIFLCRIEINNYYCITIES